MMVLPSSLSSPSSVTWRVPSYHEVRTTLSVTSKLAWLTMLILGADTQTFHVPSHVKSNVSGVGSVVGSEVGSVVGSEVGGIVGTMVGWREGSTAGSMVGSVVGVCVAGEAVTCAGAGLQPAASTIPHIIKVMKV